jgi:hypothetical protein
MFGQLCLPGVLVFGVADFCAGAGVLGVVDGEATGAPDPLFAVVSELLVLPGDAAAPAMPAAAAPVASAPATIVAPSILEMFIGEPPGWCTARSTIVRHAAKRGHRRV